MRLILDLDDDIVENMQHYCETHDITVNELVTTMFETNVQAPAEVFDDLYREKGNIKEIESFMQLLTQYLNEATYDIEESAKTVEAYETDKDMARVFKSINRDIVKQASNLTRLYQVYKERR